MYIKKIGEMKMINQEKLRSDVLIFLIVEGMKRGVFGKLIEMHQTQLSKVLKDGQNFPTYKVARVCEVINKDVENYIVKESD